MLLQMQQPMLIMGLVEYPASQARAVNEGLSADSRDITMSLQACTLPANSRFFDDRRQIMVEITCARMRLKELA